MRLLPFSSDPKPDRMTEWKATNSIASDKMYLHNVGIIPWPSVRLQTSTFTGASAHATQEIWKLAEIERARNLTIKRTIISSITKRKICPYQESITSSNALWYFVPNTFMIK